MSSGLQVTFAPARQVQRPDTTLHARKEEGLDMTGEKGTILLDPRRVRLQQQRLQEQPHQRNHCGH